jgi:hypothetical protein
MRKKAKFFIIAVFIGAAIVPVIIMSGKNSKYKNDNVFSSKAVCIETTSNNHVETEKRQNVNDNRNHDKTIKENEFSSSGGEEIIGSAVKTESKTTMLNKTNTDMETENIIKTYKSNDRSIRETNEKKEDSTSIEENQGNTGEEETEIVNVLNKEISIDIDEEIDINETETWLEEKIEEYKDEN